MKIREIKTRMIFEVCRGKKERTNQVIEFKTRVANVQCRQAQNYQRQQQQQHRKSEEKKNNRRNKNSAPKEC